MRHHAANPARRWRLLAALLPILLLAPPRGPVAAVAAAPRTRLHYAPNRNFDAHGRYLPARAGFNLADADRPDQLTGLDAGIRVLVWVGRCNGVDDAFLKIVRPFIGNARLFGFFLVDDPDPDGRVKGMAQRCPAANLKAESDWIHRRMPHARTFVILMNMSGAQTPVYPPEYAPSATGIDLYGLAPYPCRTELRGCDIAMIDRYVRAAEAIGIPRDRMVPVYQAFGGGKWTDDRHGAYVLPTAEQLCRMLRRWHGLLPRPVFDVAYSWGVQQADAALETAPRLQALFARQNRAGRTACGP